MILRLGLAAWTLLQTGGLIYGLAVTLFVLTHTLVGDRWSWVAFGGNFIPWWALGCAVIAGMMLFSCWRWPLIALQLPGIVMFLVLYGSLWLPRSEVAQASLDHDFTIATYNILSTRSDPAQVTAAITALDAELIGLQELAPDHAVYLDTALAGTYPYRVLSPLWPVHGVGLLSRHPITAHEVFTPFADSMQYLRAEVDLDGIPVVVYVVHPPPPDRILSPLTYDDTRRDAELHLLREDYLAHERGPVIVVGDFNMTDQSAAYRAMRTILRDAFRETGRGLGFTWPAESYQRRDLLPRLIRIDYVWYSDHFTALSARTASDSGSSDHRPVIATLALSGTNAEVQP